MPVRELHKANTNKSAYWTGKNRIIPEDVRRKQIKTRIKNFIPKENISYSGIHHWLRRNLIKYDYCQNCGGDEFRLEWANISKLYKRDATDYICLCKSCHTKWDSNLIELDLTKINLNHATKY